jgi:hypothetical protein
LTDVPTGLERAFEYWCNVEKEVGDRIAQAVQGA